MECGKISSCVASPSFSSRCKSHASHHAITSTAASAAFLLYLHVPSKADPVRLSALLVEGIEPHAVQSITAYIGKEFFEAFTLQVLPFLKGVALARLNKPAEARLSLTVAAHLHVKPRAGSRFPGGGHQHECWLQAGCPVGCCLLLFSGVQVNLDLLGPAKGKKNLRRSTQSAIKCHLQRLLVFLPLEPSSTLQKAANSRC